MTTETFTPASPYTISGTGPYAIPFEYSDQLDIRAEVVEGDVVIPLTTSSYTIAPTTYAASGNLTLTSGAATTYAGKTLSITRATRLEQGWVGNQTSREKGLERQIDINTRHGQDIEEFLHRVPRLPLTSAPTDPELPSPLPGAILIATAEGWVNGPTVDSLVTTPTAAREFTSFASLKAYTGDALVIGTTVRTLQEGFAYTVVSSGHQVTTNGGDRLAVLPGTAGTSIKAFGATGDGTTDDSAAIQAALNWAKPTSGLTPPNMSRALFVPKGTYIIGTSLDYWSGIILFGEGVASTFKSGGSLSTQIILLRAFTSNQCRFIHIRDMNFETTGTIRSIRANNSTLFLDSKLSGLTFQSRYCIDLTDLTCYSQSIVIEKCTSYSEIDMFIRIHGNRCSIVSCNSEGQLGSTSDVLVDLQDCSHIRVADLLLETSNGNAAKTLLRAVDSDVTFENVWLEATPTSGYGFILDNTTAQFSGILRYINPTTNKIQLSNDSHARFNRLSINGTAAKLREVLELDSTSSVVIEELNCRFFDDLLLLDDLKKRVRVDRTFINSGIEANGYQRRASAVWRGGNFLINPSFEAGVYNWNISGGPTVRSVEPSEVGPGNMLRLIYAANGSNNCTQTYPITAAQVGQPITITLLTKCVAGAAGAWCSINASGAGLVTSGSNGAMSYARVGSGWQMLCQTITPLAAGTLTLGFNWFNASEVCLDQASAYFGTDGEPNRATFGSLELNQHTVAYAAAAPTTGTWKTGDIVFNDNAAAGGFIGWVCTTAGTPGTWKTFGAISP